MRIESIEIRNYRQYKNVTYRFKKKKYDLHIIKGKNGMGKTNLLNAINWCLYNEEPHLGIKNSGKPKVNIEELRNAKELGKDKCDILVRINVVDDDTTLIFERKQEFSCNEEDIFEFKPQFTVTRIPSSGETEVFSNNEDTRRYVKMYMPEEIREYFFFDGEHLEQYFISEQGEKIKEAVHVISQVQLLTSMKDRLNNVIKELQNEAGKKNRDVQVLGIDIESIENKIKSFNKLIDEINKQNNICESIINECNEFLRGKDGVPEKEEEFQRLQNEIENKYKEKDNIDNEIKKFLIKYKTLFEFYPSVKEVYKIICTKEQNGVFPPTVDKELLLKMLNSNTCLICNRELNNEGREKIERMLAKLTSASKPAYILSGIKGELKNIIDETKEYKNIRDELINKKKYIEDSIEYIEENINKIDSYLKQFSDKDKIREMHEKRLENKKLQENNNKKRIKYELEKEDLDVQLVEIKKKRDKYIEEKKEFSAIKKKIDFAQKAKEIVENIEFEMMEEVKEKITQITMDIFNKLQWKENSFSYVKLDDNYKLELYDSNNYPSIGTCSAGERALLALSFTLAVQKVARYDSMLVIDTPVGRIDSENRAKFAEVLKNISMNKQVIITFTTSEYSKEIKNIFENISASYVELVTEDEKVTRLREEE